MADPLYDIEDAEERAQARLTILIADEPIEICGTHGCNTAIADPKKGCPNCNLKDKRRAERIANLQRMEAELEQRNIAKEEKHETTMEKWRRKREDLKAEREALPQSKALQKKNLPIRIHVPQGRRHIDSGLTTSVPKRHYSERKQTKIDNAVIDLVEELLAAQAQQNQAPPVPQQDAGAAQAAVPPAPLPPQQAAAQAAIRREDIQRAIQRLSIGTNVFTFAPEQRQNNEKRDKEAEFDDAVNSGGEHMDTSA